MRRISEVIVKIIIGLIIAVLLSLAFKDTSPQIRDAIIEAVLDDD
jgi:hypothetical protein